MMFKLTRAVLREARSRVDREEFAEARGLLAPLAETDPVELAARENARYVWRDAAALLRDAGLPEASERAWGRARELGLPARVALAESGLAYLLAGEFDAALDRVQAAEEDRSEFNPIFSSVRAIALFEVARRSEALAEWRRIGESAHRPYCPLVTHPFHLSLAAMAIERFLLSHPESRRADPEDTSSGEKAPGNSLKRRIVEIEKALDAGKSADALRWLESEGVETLKADDYSAMLYAAALGENGRWFEARDVLAQVLDRSPSSPGAQAFYACCLTQSGEPAVALAVLDRVEPAGPDDYFANYFRGATHVALDDRLRAAAAFRTAFTSYFFDTFHCALVPAWKKTVRLATRDS
ncbi:tetratricopeptide repeat protein [Candidatus Sumerlaeota bacterium]|nr:tetratricopeptide repeat protein [Candidatus Sumerlaeota bacterium]